MVIYFTEHDVISFGQYLLSDERKTNRIKEFVTVDDQEVIQQLKHVYEKDLSEWAYKVSQQANE